MKNESPRSQRKAPPEAKRRRLRPEERRVELLQAALKVLRDRGAEARVEDVTKAAGAAKGTFYLYFPSWEDLLFQVREHIVSTYASEMGQRFAKAAVVDWWTAFENECLHFVDFLGELGEAHQAIFHGPIADRPLGADESSETFIIGLLKTGIESGACRKVEVEIAARLLFSILHTTADAIAHLGRRRTNLKAMLDLLRSWLRAPDRNPTERKNFPPGKDKPND